MQTEQEIKDRIARVNERISRSTTRNANRLKLIVGALEWVLNGDIELGED